MQTWGGSGDGSNNWVSAILMGNWRLLWAFGEWPSRWIFFLSLSVSKIMKRKLVWTIRVKLMIGMSASHVRVLGFSAGSTSSSSFLLMHTLDGSKWWHNSINSYGKHKFSSWLQWGPALVIVKGIVLGNKWTDGPSHQKSLFLCFPNKQIFFKRI